MNPGSELPPQEEVKRLLGQEEAEPGIEPKEAVACYILETDDNYEKSKFLQAKISEGYSIELSPKEIGGLITQIAKDIGVIDQEGDKKEEFDENFKFSYTSATTWWLDRIREEYGEKIAQRYDLDVDLESQ